MTITAWVRPQRGEYETMCHSTRLERVDLDAALGDRTLLVGGLGTPREPAVRPP